VWHVGHNHGGRNLACVPIEVDQGANWSVEVRDSIEDGAENLRLS
jgi:hypothetical protein